MSSFVFFILSFRAEAELIRTIIIEKNDKGSFTLGKVVGGRYATLYVLTSRAKTVCDSGIGTELDRYDHLCHNAVVDVVEQILQYQRSRAALRYF
jgi:hypothetical protein